MGQKWLPVINQDYCTGCNKCVEACGHHCLKLIWDFATLTSADACGSEGHCVKVCPEGLIRMDWIPAKGDHGAGIWQV